MRDAELRRKLQAGAFLASLVIAGAVTPVSARAQTPTTDPAVTQPMPGDNMDYDDDDDMDLGWLGLLGLAGLLGLRRRDNVDRYRDTTVPPGTTRQP